MNSRVFSVSEVNYYTKRIIESDAILSEIAIKGEISNFKPHTSGHIYFTLKDKGSAISAVMFKGNVDFLTINPANGMEIIVYGYITLYEKTGGYQLYAERITKVGVGNSFTNFEILKEKLYKEGLFDDRHKKNIKKYPSHIVIVTSPTGAAIEDITKVFATRNKCIKLSLVPVLVQGEHAPSSIIAGLKKADLVGADTIILARGGGSFEDLNAFNDESVVRTVFSLKTPIVSAIGHEIDFTLCDFVSDIRGATPSQGAELCSVKLDEIKNHIANLDYTLEHFKNNILAEKKNKLKNLSKHYVFKKLDNIVLHYKKDLNTTTNLLKMRFSANLQNKNKHLLHLESIIKNLSPQTVLERGFSITYDKSGSIIKDTKNINIGDTIHIRLPNGKLGAIVNKK